MNEPLLSKKKKIDVGTTISHKFGSTAADALLKWGCIPVLGRPQEGQSEYIPIQQSKFCSQRTN